MGRRIRMRSTAPLSPERACALPSPPPRHSSSHGLEGVGEAGGEEVTSARRARGGGSRRKRLGGHLWCRQERRRGPMPAEKMALDGPEQVGAAPGGGAGGWRGAAGSPRAACGAAPGPARVGARRAP